MVVTIQVHQVNLMHNVRIGADEPRVSILTIGFQIIFRRALSCHIEEWGDNGLQIIAAQSAQKRRSQFIRVRLLGSKVIPRNKGGAHQEAVFHGPGRGRVVRKKCRHCCRMPSESFIHCTVLTNLLAFKAEVDQWSGMSNIPVARSRPRTGRTVSEALPNIFSKPK